MQENPGPVISSMVLGAAMVSEIDATKTIWDSTSLNADIGETQRPTELARVLARGDIGLGPSDSKTDDALWLYLV